MYKTRLYRKNVTLRSYKTAHFCNYNRVKFEKQFYNTLVEFSAQ